jgi:hypothetical protein
MSDMALRAPNFLHDLLGPLRAVRGIYSIDPHCVWTRPPVKTWIASEDKNRPSANEVVEMFRDGAYIGPILVDSDRERH